MDLGQTLRIRADAEMLRSGFSGIPVHRDRGGLAFEAMTAADLSTFNRLCSLPDVWEGPG